MRNFEPITGINDFCIFVGGRRGTIEWDLSKMQLLLPLFPISKYVVYISCGGGKATGNMSRLCDMPLEEEIQD